MILFYKSNTIKLLSLFAIGFITMSNSVNPPNNKTGAPGGGFCTECHNPPSSSIDGMVEIEGVPVMVEPNKTYNLTVKATLASGSSTRAGFQMVALDASGANSGTLSNNGSGTAISTAGSKDFFEHAGAKSFDGADNVSWTVDWTAPDGPIGEEITFYAASLLANGNGATSGDKTIGVQWPVTLDMESNTADIEDELNINIYPNPVNASSQVSWSGGIDVNQISILDLSGKLVSTQRNPANNINLDINQLNNNQVYIVRIETALGLNHQKIMVSK